MTDLLRILLRGPWPSKRASSSPTVTYSFHHRKAVWIKNLRIVEKDLSSVFLVDDNPGNFFRTIDNGIPIKEWKNDDENDRALLDLLPMLRELRIVSDVRPVLRREFGDRKQWPWNGVVAR